MDVDMMKGFIDGGKSFFAYFIDLVSLSVWKHNIKYILLVICTKKFYY